MALKDDSTAYRLLKEYTKAKGDDPKVRNNFSIHFID